MPSAMFLCASGSRTHSSQNAIDYAATGSEFDKSPDGLLAEAAHEEVSCTRKPSGGCHRKIIADYFLIRAVEVTAHSAMDYLGARRLRLSRAQRRFYAHRSRWGRPEMARSFNKIHHM